MLFVEAGCALRRELDRCMCIIGQCFLNLSVQKNLWQNMLKHRFLGSRSWRFWLSQSRLAQEFAFLISSADLYGP